MTAPASTFAPRVTTRSAVLTLGVALLAVWIGALIGNPTPGGTLMLAVILWFAAQVFALTRPFQAFLLLAGTPFLLIVYAVTENNYVNFFDLLVPALFMAGYLGRARTEADVADARLASPAQLAIREANAKFQKATFLFLGLSLLSLVQIVWRTNTADAGSSFVFIVRAVEGGLIFPLAFWWLRTERRILHTLTAVLVMGAVFAAVNFYQVFGLGTARAGITWVVNHPDWQVESANEGAISVVYFWIFILIRHRLRPSFWTFVMLALALFLLALTQSRSGLLLLTSVVVLSTKRLRWQHVLIGVVLVAVVALFARADYVQRLSHSVTFKKGTFDVYSIMIRVYGYQSSMRVFLSHPIIGVGFLGCRYISQAYNDLGLTMLGAENLYLETASGLGIVGLVVLGNWYVRAVQVGRAVTRVVPRDSLAHAFGAYHLPLLVGLSVWSMVGDGLMGMTGVGQLALWFAMLVRSSQIAVERAEREAPAPA